MGSAVIRTISDVNAQWVSEILHQDVTGFTAERIGDGAIGNVYRIHLEYGPDSKPGPESVVIKMAASDEQTRRGGLSMGLYEVEVRFYTDIAPHLGSALTVPCYHTAFDKENGYFHVLLQDLPTAVVGDDIVGASLEQARVAVAELGRLHGLLLRRVSIDQVPWAVDRREIDPVLLRELYVRFVDAYGHLLSAEHRAIGQEFVDNYAAWHEAQGASSTVRGFIHGDYRLENMLFSSKDGESHLTLVDWQTGHWGPLFSDISFFLSVSLTPETRRAHGEELLHLYHTELQRSAPIPVAFEQCSDGVRMQGYFGLLQAIVASMSLERTDRGDELFVTMFTRPCEFIIDTKALDVLPRVTPRPHLKPLPTDENPHPYGTDPLHNESWYFDVVDPEQDLGLWVRLGITPNQAGSWYHALLCGPNTPTVGIIDFEAPHPGYDLVVRTDDYYATHEAVKPLQTYRITAAGKGEAFDDPAAILRGEPGRPVTVKLDLVYETDGAPYAWRLATRYEIPCSVTGTFSWDDQTVRFTRARGQRDHSWGVRNWWNADWIWSAFHLDDGTHLHHCDIRPHNYRHFAVGYVQEKVDDQLRVVELTDVRGKEVMDPDTGLGVETTITMAPCTFTMSVKPRGHAPLRLDAKDEAEGGKVAKFPRSWATVTTDDGRKGVGWLEWNIVEK